jgi:hypothetical protein
VSRKLPGEGRIVSVLSDGLGSGVKASVLANLTATMALRYTAAFRDLRQSAQTIMDTLPICEQRRISYSTFTILDLEDNGRTRVIEHGNPPVLVLRGAAPLPLPRAEITLERWHDRAIGYREFEARLGDRLVFYSDGISQSGLGRRGFALGWGEERVADFLSRRIEAQADVPALELARQQLGQALENDEQRARDDMSCGVVHFRRPQRLLVVTGPPFCPERDAELAQTLETFSGRKAICGGTTATLLARHLNRPVTLLPGAWDAETPPAARMEGVDLVTEGALTLAQTASLLEGPGPLPAARDHPARALAALMVESDVVEFVVGTRVNEAHQDPAVPVELDLRRNIVRRIAATLESRYLKETRIRFL